MAIRYRNFFFNEINRRFSSLLKFYLFFTMSYTSVLAEQPFFFDPFTLKIYNSPYSTDVNPKIPYAAACPSAQNGSEEKMNKSLSMDHKALFVRQYCGVSESQSDETMDITCTKKFELAATYSRTYSDHIQFGYEVYFKKRNAPKHPRRASTSYYFDYGPISEARSDWKEFVNKWIKRPASPTLGKGADKELEFVWIPQVTLRYDPYKWSVIRSEYTIHHGVAEDLTLQCNNYNLGHDFYNKKHGPFDEFFSPDRQKKIFSAVKSFELSESSVCKTMGKCVKKYDFLKPYLFRSSYGSPISCSNLATIPIWFEVAEELLNNLEIFLFALSQKTENPLTIIPGIHGILSFSTNGTRKSNPVDMYLYPKRERIPVPKILYKVVSYKSHDCKTKKTLCWFYMVIVVHNHPGPVKGRMICPQDLCEHYGWEKIKFINRPKQGEGSEYIYCCELDDAIQREIGYVSYFGQHEALNLKKFPVHDKEHGDIRREDRQTDIETKMDQLQNEVLEISKTKLKN